ncbi:synaptic vesicle glycoprotein 2A-like [Phlebotomus argentipes]|uniref:synaptic vesicle glycoprotein 2A-like n=1 Tax=Phlebotomus argentipes TaxID=94469 RepID=UPI0028931836|nr:synaptic vesicle glycoprotein 2A-like [Phlebotomus argentipes]
MVVDASVVNVEVLGGQTPTPDRKDTAVDVATGSDFETAIAATGYGRFNIFILAIALFCCLGSINESTTMAYILPAAECDLNLSLQNKGMLNAITYMGMITSAFLWGYLADTLGRREILGYGYIIMGIFETACGFSQTLWMLLVFKYISGFVACGPFAVLMSYVAEMHGAKHRARIVLTVGTFFSIGNIILPCIAWAVLPRSWTVTFVANIFELHSWHIFLLICATPSLLGGTLVVLLLPESPKFLMSRGRNDEALAIFQRIFHENTGKAAHEYPIRALIDELRQSGSGQKALSGASSVPKSKGCAALKDGLSQIAPMLKRPHLRNCCLVFSIQFGVLMSQNTIRLWLPEIFHMMAEYSKASNDPTNHTTSMCDIIDASQSIKSANSTHLAGQAIQPVECTATPDSSVYFNALIVGIVSLVGYLIAGFIINKIGNRNLMIFGLVVSGLSAYSMYFGINLESIVAAASICVGIGSICSTAMMGQIAILFPTSLRTMTISLSLMFGRIGAMIGNLVFPYLLMLGCLPPFITIGSLLTVAGLAGLLLPRKSKAPLQ